MAITLSVLISIFALGMTVIGFFFQRKDKAVEDSNNSQFRLGGIVTRIDMISKQLADLSDKFDAFNDTIDYKIKEKIEEHIQIYHKP